MSVSVKNVSKAFGDLMIINDVSFAMAKGEIVSIIGPSGCGKSTLLRLMADLETLDSGIIDIDESLNESRSFVFQDPLLLDWRCLEKNIVLPLEITPLENNDQEARLKNVLKLTKLCEHRKKFPHELSGGMRMRASLARALITQPQLIFLDEPFGALDEMTRESLNLEIQEIHHKSPCTIILVTHNLNEAVFMSDKVLVMNQKGEIYKEISIDKPHPRVSDFFQEPKFHEKLNELRIALQGCES
jgi:NitT/TauT family transport system ATP-binding protein